MNSDQAAGLLSCLSDICQKDRALCMGSHTLVFNNIWMFLNTSDKEYIFMGPDTRLKIDILDKSWAELFQL